jgi:hypothetical protein
MRVIDEGVTMNGRWQVVEDGGRYMLLEIFTNRTTGLREWRREPLTREVIWDRYPAEAPAHIAFPERKRGFWERLFWGVGP